MVFRLLTRTWIRRYARISRKKNNIVYVFKIRNYSDLQAFIDEVAAIAPKGVILQMYNLATDEAYSFSTVNLISKDKHKMFLIRFDKALTLN